MKSFADWTQEIAEANNHEPEPEKDTWEYWEYCGHGILKTGGFSVTCSGCGRDHFISDYITPEEFNPDVPDSFYCGGGPRCCP